MKSLAVIFARYSYSEIFSFLLGSFTFGFVCLALTFESLIFEIATYTVLFLYIASVGLYITMTRNIITSMRYIKRMKERKFYFTYLTQLKQQDRPAFTNPEFSLSN